MTKIETQGWDKQLTEPQKACLRLVAGGMSSKEIAKETGLSPRTVDQYVNIAAQTLGVSTRREAARMLVSLESGALNKLQLKPAPIDPAPVSGTDGGASRRMPPHPPRSPSGWLPPLGGERDELSASAKVVQIVKAALVAAAAFGSIVATGAWLQSLFS